MIVVKLAFEAWSIIDMQRKCPSLGGEQADHCDEGGWYFDKDYLRIAAASQIATEFLRGVLWILFIVALCNVKGIVKNKLQEHVMRDCSWCVHLTVALLHFPIGVTAVVGLYLAAYRETQASDIHFAITRIVAHVEEKTDMLLCLCVLIVINRHYMAVKGVFDARKMRREREIMSSEIWETESAFDRSGSEMSRRSSGVSLAGSIAEERPADDKINTSGFNLKESGKDGKAADPTKPRFTSGQYTSNERLYAEGIATMFIRHDPSQAAQKAKEYQKLEDEDPNKHTQWAEAGLYV